MGILGGLGLGYLGSEIDKAFGGSGDIGKGIGGALGGLLPFENGGIVGKAVMGGQWQTIRKTPLIGMPNPMYYQVAGVEPVTKMEIGGKVMKPKKTNKKKVMKVEMEVMKPKKTNKKMKKK